MLRQSKFTQHAIAAVSRLAEVYRRPEVWLSAADIAASRNIRKPAAAKVMSLLAQARLVSGTQGPGGGYRLAHPPAEICLWDIVQLFDTAQPMTCPYGPGWCGRGDPCPLHHSLLALQNQVEAFLRQTTFSAFAELAPPRRRPDGAPMPAAARRKKSRGISTK